MAIEREAFSEKYLHGKGVEFGALHNPMHISKKNTVMYADKFPKDKLIKKFPELKEYENEIVSTDILLDLNDTSYEGLKSQKFDFYIANHVIEHLVNPIRFLKNIYDSMKPGATLYLSAPNKNLTFDKKRELTTFDHVWNEYQNNTSKLSIEHLNDFILNMTKDHIEPERRKMMYFKNDKLPLNPFRKRKIYNLHRERSIHVHVWDQHTFKDFLNISFKKLNMDFTITDSNYSTEEDRMEMIYIIQKK